MEKTVLSQESLQSLTPSLFLYIFSFSLTFFSSSLSHLHISLSFSLYLFLSLSLSFSFSFFLSLSVSEPFSHSFLFLSLSFLFPPLLSLTQSLFLSLPSLFPSFLRSRREVSEESPQSFRFKEKLFICFPFSTNTFFSWIWTSPRISSLAQNGKSTLKFFWGFKNLSC